jgi:hypothetical protein
MTIGRVIGWLLIIAAAIALAHDLVGWYGTGVFRLAALGELWHEISPTTLELAQPAIQRHIAPWLWDDGVLRLLLFPAVLVFAVPGVLLVWLGGRRARRRRRPDQLRMQ